MSAKLVNVLKLSQVLSGESVANGQDCSECRLQIVLLAICTLINQGLTLWATELYVKAHEHDSHNLTPGCLFLHCR